MCPWGKETQRDVTNGLVWRSPQCKMTKSMKLFFFFKIKAHTTIAAPPVALLGEGVPSCQGCCWGRGCLGSNMGSPVILGGPEAIVQVDESLFWCKPKVVSHNLGKLHDNILTYPPPVPSWSWNQQWGMGLGDGWHFPYSSITCM